MRTFTKTSLYGVKKGWNMKIRTMAISCLCLVPVAFAQVTLGNAAGWLESAYVEWTADGSDSYNVYYTGGGKTDVKIDDPLVRSYGTKMRADVVGLKAGDYTLKVVGVKGGREGAASVTKTLSVKAHDRSGFAFQGGRVPGGYNADGSLKSGAVVLYVSENTKDKVSLDVVTSSKGAVTACTGLQNILYSYKKGYDTRPLVVRFIGNVTDMAVLEGGDIVVETNNNASASVTLEGVGNDAVANGWGIRLKNASNVEVRNLGIMNVNSSEGDNVGLQQNNDHVWVHNCDFFYGDAGSDKDQVKGDGALDCKMSTYVTFSYNHFWDNGKSNLLGLKENSTEGYYITYHHNWYDHSDSRHPRVRFYSAHVYNNYYDGNAKYGAGSTLGSSVFMEGNYFRNCKYPMLTSMQGSDVYAGGTKRDPNNYGTFSSEDGGSIKAYGNYMEGNFTFIPYGASSYKVKGAETMAASQGVNTSADFDAYVVDSRDAKVPSTVKSYAGGNTYNNFDTDGSVMYSYTADDAATAKANVMAYAGRMQGGDFKWSFDNSTDDEAYAVNQGLKDALVAYKGTVQSIQGEGALPVFVEPSSSSSSSEPVAGSSSSVSSSSGMNGSSSSVSSSSVGPGVVATYIVHNFTTDGKDSEFFSITGNLSTSKGSVEYGSETLTQCLKMESSTEISFTLSGSARVTLVLNEDFAGAVKVNGSPVQAKAGIVEVTLEAGVVTLTKGDTGNLFLIAVSFSKDPSGNQDEPQVARASTVTNPVRIVSRGATLEISASGMRRLEMFRMDGRRVNVRVLSRDAFGANVDMDMLEPGVYMVRLVTEGSVHQQKVLKH